MPDDSTPKSIPYGYCHCGCGQKTKLANKTARWNGTVRGEPRRYLQGHNTRVYPLPNGAGSAPPNPPGLCLCGCGQTTTIIQHSRPGRGEIKGEHRKFVMHHQNNVRHQDALTKADGRRCEWCQAPLVIRSNESSHDFSKRKYCGNDCYHSSQLGRSRGPARTANPALITITCRFCGRTMTFRKGRERVYCTQECFGKAHSRWASETYADTITAHVCEFCGNEFMARRRDKRRFCSNSCASTARVRNKGLWRPTGIERQVQAALTAAGIAFVPQMRIGIWLVDVALPDLHVAIEANGSFWHCDPRVYPDGPTSRIQDKAIDRDRRKFEAIEKAGYRLIVLWERDINEQGADALLADLLGEVAAR